MLTYQLMGKKVSGYYIENENMIILELSLSLSLS